MVVCWVCGNGDLGVVMAAEPDERLAESPERLGPGGRPLRLDYPGTPESKVARMQRTEVPEERPSPTLHARDVLVRQFAAAIDDWKDEVVSAKTRVLLAHALDESLETRQFGRLHVALRREPSFFEIEGMTVVVSEAQASSAPRERSVSVEVEQGAHAPRVHVQLRGKSRVFRYLRGYAIDARVTCPEIDVKELTSLQVSFKSKPGDRIEDLELECELEAAHEHGKEVGNQIGLWGSYWLPLSTEFRDLVWQDGPGVEVTGLIRSRRADALLRLSMHRGLREEGTLSVSRASTLLQASAGISKQVWSRRSARGRITLAGGALIGQRRIYASSEDNADPSVVLWGAVPQVVLSPEVGWVLPRRHATLSAAMDVGALAYISDSEQWTAASFVGLRVGLLAY